MHSQFETTVQCLFKKFSFFTVVFLTNFVFKKHGKISILTDGSKYPYVLLFDLTKTGGFHILLPPPTLTHYLLRLVA